MAESYINALSGDFEPEEFSDEYRQALEEVIEAKVAGHEVVAPAEEPRATGQVVDLMEALRRSVAEAKERRGDGVGRRQAGEGSRRRRRPRSRQKAAEDTKSSVREEAAAKRPPPPPD